MKTNLYHDAIASTAIPKLTTFLKTEELEIPEWKNLKAAEKRAAVMDLLKTNISARAGFVPFFTELNPGAGYSTNWSDWEADAETEGDEAETSTPTPTPSPASNVTKLPTKAAAVAETISGADVSIPSHGAFVEGSFDMMISDAAGLDAVQATAALRAVEDDLEFQHMRIGVLLGHVQSSQHFLTLGYNNMREYIDGETNLDYRKGMYLIKNAAKVQELSIPAADLKGVSWAALRYIIPVLEVDNYKPWLEAARSMTHLKLRAAVDAATVKAAALPAPKGEGTPVPETSDKVFKLDPGQKATIEQALEKAKVEGNTDNNAKALEVIAATYVGSPLPSAVMPPNAVDTSDETLTAILTKLREQEGDDGLIRLLNVVEAVWPDPAISIDFPEATSTAAE